MILRHCLHTDPVVAASYIVGCGGRSACVVVDPVQQPALGRGLSGNPRSTLGFERRFNRSFAIDGEEAFVRAMLSDIPPAPPHALSTWTWQVEIDTRAETTGA